ncbi:MFS transporter [Jannaschia sp. Os4]|nr:MFS transporter [Jannaschia sp. Os4]
MIALLYVTGLLSALQFGKVSLFLPALVDRYPAAPFLVSAVAVLGILGGVLAGGVVAKVGARRAILGAVAVSAVLSLAQAPLPAFAPLMALRLAEGAGHLALVVALPTMMAAESSDADRPVVMGIWGTFFGVGFALGALVPVAGPGAAFAAHGIGFAALLPLLWWALPRVPGEAGPLPDPVAAHRAVWSSARLIAPGVGHGIYTSLFIALLAFLPDILASPWLAAWLPLANLTGTFVAGFLARRVEPGRLVTWSFVASAAGFALLLATRDPWIALATFFATGSIAGAGFAAVPWLNPAPGDRARANGGMAQIGNVGTFAGTPLMAAALTLGGAWVIATALAICLFGAAATAAVYRAARRPAAMVNVP